MPSRDTILIIIATTLLLSILPLISKEGESKHGCPNHVYDSPDITYICEVKKVQKTNNNFITVLTQNNYQYTYSNNQNLDFENSSNLKIKLVFDSRLGSYNIQSVESSTRYKELTSTIERVVYLPEPLKKGDYLNLEGLEKPFLLRETIPKEENVLTINSYNNGKYFELQGTQ